MEQYQGKTVINGIGIGKIYAYTRNQYRIEKQDIEDTQKEWIRYETAEKQVALQLSEAYEKAVDLVGAKSAAIFERQEIVLREGAFGRFVKNTIEKEHVCAEYAVSVAGDYIFEKYKSDEHKWDNEERENMNELVRRLLVLLVRKKEYIAQGEDALILSAKELSPGDLLQMDRNRIQGLITEIGSGESHTAVLAAAMQIPFMTGIPFRVDWDGKKAIVDGENKRVILDPEEDECTDICKRMEQKKEEREKLNQFVKEKAVTLDGDRLYVYANIGDVRELEEAVRCRAAGIGLFRSEFLYMERENYPTEEEQFLCYKTLINKMQGRPVNIRTLDIGADKKISYLRMEQEQNPAMGNRGIRFCLEQEELFRTQLKALYRAATYGDLGVLYPMISSEDELDRIEEIIQDIQEEMDAKQIPYGKVRQGVMIETPAAAILCEHFAKRVDFISVGTNDLIQYTVVADRQNAKVSHLCKSNHPAIIKMLQMIVKDSHACNVPVTVCGEMAADLTMIQTLVELGVDIVSVTPAQILPVRREVRNTSIRK